MLNTTGANKPASYLALYSRIFEPLREAKVRVLEMGIADGSSLLLWRDYFPNGLIVGLDRVVPHLEEDRIVMFAGEQDDLPLLDQIGSQCGPFDIIIDDCSHIGRMAETSFWHLFRRYLKMGGTYAIEDWGTGYWSDWPDGQKGASMVDFVRGLVDEVGRNDRERGTSRGTSDAQSELASFMVMPGLAMAVKSLP